MFLRELREQAGKVLDEVAEDIGITKQHLSMIELGQRGASLPVAFKLAKYYGVPVENIFLTSSPHNVDKRGENDGSRQASAGR